MEKRVFGRTGIELSVLGFGCGAVGGLMVRGDPRDQERTITRAIGAGVNYFDTAVQYGNGESEKNLGRILHQLKRPDAVVGTKVRLPSALKTKTEQQFEDEPSGATSFIRDLRSILVQSFGWPFQSIYEVWSSAK